MAAEKRRSMADILAEQRAKLGEPLTVAPEATFQPPAAPPAVRRPMLSEVDHDTPQLHEVEREELANCEKAIDTLRTAFWVAGQALRTVRAARLYRETHSTFEEYVADRWEMSRPQAYRLMDAAPLAERLSPIGDTRLNEAQVRELMPVAAARGNDAAEVVYRTIVEADGVKVTAGVIRGAVRVLPEDGAFDQDEAVARIRAYLAGEVQPPAAEPLDPGERVERFRAGLRRIKVDEVRAAGPEAVRELAGELRALADAMEKVGE